MMHRFKNMLTKNVGLKLFSFAMAIGLWFMAVGRESGELGLTVPLEMVNFPPDMVVASQVPNGINVRIRGPLTLTRQAAERKLRFSLDLSQAKPGPNEFSLLPDTLSLPRGLHVTHLAPSSVRVKLEKVISKKLSLLPVIKGEPITGYTIENISLEPKQVDVRGPESVLGPVEILWTEPIDVTKLKETATLVTRPALPDMSITLVKPGDIKAHLNIGEKIVTRRFQSVPVQVLNSDLPAEIDPKTVDVTIRGPVSGMTDLVSGQGLDVRVNLAGLEPGVHERMLVVNVPPKMGLVKAEPKVVKIHIMDPNKVER